MAPYKLSLLLLLFLLLLYLLSLGPINIIIIIIIIPVSSCRWRLLTGPTGEAMGRPKTTGPTVCVTECFSWNLGEYKAEKETPFCRQKSPQVSLDKLKSTNDCNC